MRYILFICGEERSPMVDSAAGAVPATYDGWGEEMKRRGVLLDAAALWPTSDATTVKVREGGLQLVDGPFAGTRDRIGGFCLIECADMEEAIAVAEAHPAACSGLVEIRPVRET